MIRLDFTQLHELASVEALIEPVRLAFLEGATVPQRLHYDIGEEAGDATLLLMPSWRAGERLGIKIATVCAGNPARGLPSVSAQYLLLDAKTGQFLASLDGRALTLLRTAAVSALAADLLAPVEPQALLLVGTGALIPYLASGHTAVRGTRRSRCGAATRTRPLSRSPSLRAMDCLQKSPRISRTQSAQLT